MAAAAGADVAVLGAGLSGLVAARALSEAGARVVVVDKGRGPGGRLATRRITGPGGTARLDHGAQFLTVRSAAFAALVDGWPLHVWHHGAAQAPSIDEPADAAVAAADGHPRFAAIGGMTAIARHLAQGLDVRLDHRVDAVRPVDAGGWRLRGDDGRPDLHADRVVLTAPVPQIAALLPDVTLPDDVASLGYDPCIALLAVLADGPRFGPLRQVQFDDGAVQSLADNTTKGISEVPAVTVHARGDWSAARYDDDDAVLDATLRDLVAPWLGAAVVASQIKRWRYATPRQPHPDRAVTVAEGLVLAGDTFGEAKVEGAARSGLAAAALLG